jgi:hypothetical protein
MHDRTTREEEILILTPAAPLVSIMENTAGWDRTKSRCGTITSRVLETNVPVPVSFSTDPGYDGLTPNMSTAMFLANGHTIIQNQPFHRCAAGGAATSQYTFPRVDLYGEAIAGSPGAVQGVAAPTAGASNAVAGRSPRVCGVFRGRRTEDVRREIRERAESNCSSVMAWAPQRECLPVSSVKASSPARGSPDGGS